MLKRLFNEQEKVINIWRRFRLKLVGVDLESSCWIGQQVSATLGFANGTPGKIKLASEVRLEQGVILQAWGGSIVIDKNVFIGPYTVIYGHGDVTVGKDTLIAMHCRILSSNHTIPDKNKPIRCNPDILLPVNIGEDVWLGAGVTILGGVTIGNGCVVGAGAVVTKDLPPYSVAVGVPAKVVRNRL
ncbi:DapH/DapD/GlmU-related protein [Aulosira sp. FACHB-615]|uniref:acyltransferase n=1 Tax=Aulosira sp. FACHB-615 TaxID=2692777 RepID=UPI001687A43E|nr:acyltransferase [Aulosira sp. FACHB-615]MBD2491113.1 acyltransferase [Aulosira sp. FACHB-615]